jgi:phage shock protein B
MGILEFLFVPLILVLTVVLPCWIIFHNITRWRSAKVISAEDEKMLAELWESAAKMESRINSLERILDAEAPEWRTKI